MKNKAHPRQAQISLMFGFMALCLLVFCLTPNHWGEGKKRKKLDQEIKDEKVSKYLRSCLLLHHRALVNIINSAIT